MTDREILCDEFSDFKPPDDWNGGSVKSKRIAGVCAQMPPDCSTATPKYNCFRFDDCHGMCYQGKPILLEKKKS